MGPELYHMGGEKKIARSQYLIEDVLVLEVHSFQKKTNLKGPRTQITRF